MYPIPEILILTILKTGNHLTQCSMWQESVISLWKSKLGPYQAETMTYHSILIEKNTYFLMIL